MKYFGTDGIRDKVDSVRIHPTTILKLGWAFGMMLNQRKYSGAILIAKDTRLSGYMLESALESGFSAAGRDIKLLGPLPTPAVGVLVKQDAAAGAIVISASHNSYDYNGLKFFGSDGNKLDNTFQQEIEHWMSKDFHLPNGGAIGRAGRIVDAADRYIDHLVSQQRGKTNLSQMKIVFDGANGAAYRIGPAVFKRLKAKLTPIACRPDGLNINHKCGSTYIQNLQRAVLERNADYGVATDGDADRLYMVDQDGNIYDGDRLLYALLVVLAQKNEMKGGVVGTVQSNQGLEKAVNAFGYPFVRTPVGDKHVLNCLRANDWLIGGESSGHLVDRGMSECCDGLMIAIHLLCYLKESDQYLADLVEDLELLPAVNATINAKWPIENGEISEEEPLKSYLGELNEEGYRVVVRPSGTEAVIRILVEGKDIDKAQAKVNKIQTIVKDFKDLRLH